MSLPVYAAVAALMLLKAVLLDRCARRLAGRKLGGRACGCGTAPGPDDRPPGVRHPVACLTYVVASMTIVARYGVTPEAAGSLGLADVLLVTSLTDLDLRIIPNGCVAALVVLHVVRVLVAEHMGLMPSGQTAWDVLVPALACSLAVLGTLVALAVGMDALLGHESVGGGDVKLLSAVAFCLGWRQFLLALVMACLLGIAGYLAEVLGRGALGWLRGGHAAAGGPAGTFPWGPSIALACWLTQLFGQQVVSRCLSLSLGGP